MPTITVFVYGSLKRGFHNHAQMDGATHTGSAKVAGYLLCAVASANFPAVAESEPECAVRGELYTLPEGDRGRAMLAKLDRFEGAPRMYRRTAVTTTAGAVVWMYVWAGDPLALRPLSTENWTVKGAK
jgi:gamma-glutamylaminecyclotransferase